MLKLAIPVLHFLNSAAPEDFYCMPDAAKVIRWSGTIQYQKWRNFYTKVVSPFASTAGLSFRVEVEVPAEKDEQQAKVQLERIRGALSRCRLSLAINVILFSVGPIPREIDQLRRALLFRWPL